MLGDHNLQAVRGTLRLLGVRTCIARAARAAPSGPRPTERYRPKRRIKRIIPVNPVTIRVAVPGSGTANASKPWKFPLASMYQPARSPLSLIEVMSVLRAFGTLIVVN